MGGYTRRAKGVERPLCVALEKSKHFGALKTFGMMIELVDYMFGQNYVDQTQKALGFGGLAENIVCRGYDVLFRGFRWHDTPQDMDVWNLRNARMKHYYGLRIDNEHCFRTRRLDDDPLLPT